MSVDIDPRLVSLGKTITRLGHELEDMSPVMRAIIPVMQRGLEQNIMNKGRGIEDPWWEDSDPAYIVRKKAQGFPAMDLFRTGKLMGQVRGGGGSIETVGKRFAKFELDLKYAKSVNFRYKKNNISGKKFIGFSRKTKTKITGMIEDYVQQKVISLVENGR